MRQREGCLQICDNIFTNGIIFPRDSWRIRKVAAGNLDFFSLRCSPHVRVPHGQIVPPSNPVFKWRVEKHLCSPVFGFVLCESFNSVLWG